MTIKILKKGVIPPEPKFQMYCAKCNTHFTYQDNDMFKSYVNYSIIHCPWCGFSNPLNGELIPYVDDNRLNDVDIDSNGYTVPKKRQNIISVEVLSDTRLSFFRNGENLGSIYIGGCEYDWLRKIVREQHE